MSPNTSPIPSKIKDRNVKSNRPSHSIAKNELELEYEVLSVLTAYLIQLIIILIEKYPPTRLNTIIQNVLILLYVFLPMETKHRISSRYIYFFLN